MHQTASLCQDQQVLTKAPVAKLVMALDLLGSVDAECSCDSAVHQLDHPSRLSKSLQLSLQQNQPSSG